MIPVNSNKEYAKNVDILFLFRFVTDYGKEILNFTQKIKHAFLEPSCVIIRILSNGIPRLDDSCPNKEYAKNVDFFLSRSNLMMVTFSTTRKI